MDASEDITKLLNRRRDDGTPCVDELLPLVYPQLRRLAHSQLRRLRPGQTLGTTVLVNEGYVKIFGGRKTSWRDRGHFLAASAQAMRHILVDAARRRVTERQGSGKDPLPLLVEPAGHEANPADVLEVNRTLNNLAKFDQRLCRVVECRYFAGMTEEETASALNISARTVHRDWLRARAWLKRALT